MIRTTASSRGDGAVGNSCAIDMRVTGSSPAGQLVAFPQK